MVSLISFVELLKYKQTKGTESESHVQNPPSWFWWISTAVNESLTNGSQKPGWPPEQQRHAQLGTCKESRFSSYPRLTEAETLGWGPGVCTSAGLPVDSSAYESMRITACGHLRGLLSSKRSQQLALVVKIFLYMVIFFPSFDFYPSPPTSLALNFLFSYSHWTNVSSVVNLLECSVGKAGC